MRNRLLVLAVALIIASMMGIANGLAWGQYHGGCEGNEGDHGRGCLPTTKEECKYGGWQTLNVFEYLFEKQGVCE
jgi:hypothetical protein